MEHRNKLIILLMNIFVLLTLSACSSSSLTENGTVDATTNITWDSEKNLIVVSTVTIKCNDAYYGVVVNDSINFNNKNNYFTTKEGLLIQITDNEETLVSNGSSYSYKATIEENVSLYVSGNDEDKVKEVFNNIFKTNKESYQMFSHDINQDWINNVVITSDVVSLSNNTDTTYIHQNEGSLSPGCLDGKIEPTVFKKQLRGIDIPITYPEDIEGVSNYIPYGTQTYDHWTNEGYTPYSAYTTIDDKDGLLYKGNNDKYTQDTTEATKLLDASTKTMSNFIILANNDSNVLGLFKEKNNHTQNLYSITSSKIDINSSLEVNTENLSDKKDIASSVINSENRYHFGILNKSTTPYLKQWTESNADGYYVDGNGYSPTNNVVGGMTGKFVAPTIKVSMPTYDDASLLKKYSEKVNDINDENTPDAYRYALESVNFLTNSAYSPIYGHGATGALRDYLNFDITRLTYQRNNLGFDNHWLNLQYYMLEGDYVYYLNNYGSLFIYENVSTYMILGDTFGGGLFFDQDFITGLMTNYNQLTTGSCFQGGNLVLHQIYYVRGEYKY